MKKSAYIMGRTQKAAAARQNPGPRRSFLANAPKF